MIRSRLHARKRTRDIISATEERIAALKAELAETDHHVVGLSNGEKIWPISLTPEATTHRVNTAKARLMLGKIKRWARCEVIGDITDEETSCLPSFLSRERGVQKGQGGVYSQGRASSTHRRAAANPPGADICGIGTDEGRGKFAISAIALLPHMLSRCKSAFVWLTRSSRSSPLPLMIRPRVFLAASWARSHDRGMPAWEV